MRIFFAILVGLALLGVLGVLIAGMVGIARGQDPRRSNKLMQYRVTFQALAIVLLVLGMLMLRG